MPDVYAPGQMDLAGTIIGLVERAEIIDGSHIVPGDLLVGLPSSGLHTNGYSLVRALLARRPEVAAMPVTDESFLEHVLRPHTCYYRGLRGLFALPGLHGMAHITGGGLAGNLNRILPAGMSARVDLDAIRILPIFRAIRELGQVDEADMLRTFNLGVGMALVVAPEAADAVCRHLADAGHHSYGIGAVTKGEQQVVFDGRLRWQGAAPL
jgi:phosphoribosylformylglycinamidine cyclo-ligase